RPVVLVSNEDSWEHTIGPRLRAAGADLAKVHRPDGGPILFPRDLPKIKDLVGRTGAALLVCDPILSCVGDFRTDSNAATHVRRFLQPLLDATRETGVATVLVRHFKKEGAAAIHRGLGSQAFTAVCRLQHVVGRADDSGRVVLASAKNNLGPLAGSLAYSIE